MKIAVSACLLGENCKYNGGNNRSELLLKCLEGHEIIPICPECLGGLPTPRYPAEIVGGVVINDHGICVDKEFHAGARRALEIVQQQGAELVILQSRSPSCGVRQIYDGSFSGTLVDGQGVFARLAGEAGMNVVDVEDLDAYGLCAKAPRRPIEHWVRLRENVWHIEESGGVFCTLIRGEKLAILVDTGCGGKDLRSFVEAHVSTPYLVVNTHGHPDHAGGNDSFPRVWLHPEELDTLHHYFPEPRCALLPLSPGQIFDLGGLTVEIVPLCGHTKGSIGLLIREERLLVAGDGLNEQLWMFTPGHDTLAALKHTLIASLEREFDTFIGSHGQVELPRRQLLAHLENLEQGLQHCAGRRRLAGYDTLWFVWSGSSGRSAILLTPDTLDGISQE